MVIDSHILVYSRIEMYKTFYTDVENVKHTLKKYGVAVIPNILSKKQVKRMRKGMWDTLEQMSQKLQVPIDRDDTDTWKKSFAKFYPKHSMLIQYWGIGHAQFVWDVRQNLKVKEVFEKIWDEEKLLVSFDGVSIHMGHEILKRGYHAESWYHCDQSFKRNNFECVQGFVTAYNAREGDATLAVLTKSHKYHKEMAEVLGKDVKGTDWHLLNDEQKNFYLERGCKERFVKCTAGSLVLWDSRTIHCGKNPDRDRFKWNMRLVVYVCMTPRKWATEKNLEKKRQALVEKRMTSHWPHKIKLFPLKPYTYGAPVPPIEMLPDPVLNKTGKKLAGF